MPIYDFTCQKCDCVFEALILRRDDSPGCPECGSPSARRETVSLFSCTGVNITKRLKMESEDRMKQGMAQATKQKRRQSRIKTL